MENIFRKEIAGIIADAVRAAYPARQQELESVFGGSGGSLDGFVYTKIESPKDRRMGDFAFPVFVFAKALRQKPPEIAAAILAHLPGDDFTAAGPYINVSLSAAVVARSVLPATFERGETYGAQEIGAGKTIVIDFSSPNIAKPFGIGHLRSTAIGNSLYRLHQKLGYTVVGINHLGDWGTQFGKMIVAFTKWGREEDLSAAPVKYLFDLYVRFHDEEEKDPGLSDEARRWFKRLEDGDDEAVRLWNLFKDYSLREFKRVYDMLGVRFDHYTGESFYNDKMDAVVERLEKAGLAEESEGALVVKLDDYKLNPCLLRKADGATLYATRDLAGVFYRYEAFAFHKALYVVGSAQQEHFRQVFKVIELLGEPYAERLVHVDFGWIRFRDQAMSTRKGNIIFLDDVIGTAVEKATAIIREKNPDLTDLETTARQIGIGAVIFADLGVKKHKDVNFSWDEVLNFEGETGPYLQYTHARLCALGRKYGRDVAGDVDFDLFEAVEEKALLLHIYQFIFAIEAAAEKYEPNIIAEYLLELAAMFNRFYQRKDDDGKLVKIIDEEHPDETAARMLLVGAVRVVIKEGLRLMGIEAPEEM